VFNYHYNGRLSDFESRDWIYTFELLLEYGADVNVKTMFETSKGVLVFDISKVINMCFGYPFPQESAELLALVKNSSHKDEQRSNLQRSQQGPQKAPAQKGKPSAISRSKLWLDKGLLRGKRKGD
jgi:hypothetical protein